MPRSRTARVFFLTRPPSRTAYSRTPLEEFANVETQQLARRFH